MGFRHPLPPALRVRFELADGSLLERDWTMVEPSAMWVKAGPPEWLEDAARHSGRGPDPILLTGRVKAGFEDVARQVVLG